LRGAAAVKAPRVEHVRLDEQKIRGYLLSATHPVGRFKAKVFAALGFDATNMAAFVAELRRIAATGEVSDVEDIEYGRKYTIPGELNGPTGTAKVLTVWIQETGQEEVRLVTVRPR
jgi:hypothetical protein